jgi:DNA-directed RNA polymerase specialized sigma24 family protein
MTDCVLLVRRPLRPATLDRLRTIAANADAMLVIDRRCGADRRAPEAIDDLLVRRDRRVGERRAAVRVLPLTTRLPLRLLPHRAGLCLVERTSLPAETLADHEALRLLVRHADGDPYAARTLFESWFDRAYAYLSGWLDDARGAQVAAQAAFLALLRQAPTLDVQRTSFRVLLVDELHAASGLNAAINGVHLAPVRARPVADDGVLERLGRLNQLDLYVLLARLTSDERRIVMLRHVLKLDAADAAHALDLGEHDLDQAEGSALRRLLLEVQRIGDGHSRDGERVPMRAVARHSPVVRSRRAALALRA